MQSYYYLKSYCGYISCERFYENKCETCKKNNVWIEKWHMMICSEMLKLNIYILIFNPVKIDKYIQMLCQILIHVFKRVGT